MYARVYKKVYSYQVFFQGQWFTYAKEKDAKEKAFELNFEFFLKYPDKLPKGITVDRTDKRFRFFIRLNNETVHHIKSSKDLSKLIEIRNHILKNLLDLF